MRLSGSRSGDDWGHLYLYDLESGRLKSRITEGSSNVLQVRRVDREARTLYFTGVGREPGDPYFEYLYRVGLDGGDVTLLTPDSANHIVTLSPSVEYFVDSYSTPIVPPITVVRSTVDGKVLLAVEEADVGRLMLSGWQPPIPIQVKARDGVTDLHGLMYRPSNFDPDETYPILNYLYPGPQSGSVGSRSFNPSRGDKQALAELGFIVVEVDAMGTPGRSKSFHEAYYGNMGDNGVPDQMAAITELAGRYPWMDLDRVGIWGHSGGGFASADAIMRYPDFYDVAVSQAGNHDNRNYEDDWGEKWQGLLETYADGTTNYDNQANQLLAEDLKGKLPARARHPGYQRAAVQHAPRRGPLDRGQQGLRPHHAPQSEPWIRERALHDASALGLLRAPSARSRASRGLRDRDVAEADIVARLGCWVRSGA